MEKSIGEIAKTYQISVRTLRYYDEIGLLKPAFVTDTGYRMYRQPQLERLSQILFYKELGISLAQIQAIINSPAHNDTLILQQQYTLLLAKQAQTSAMLQLVKTALSERGETMKSCNNNKTVQQLKDEYANEVKQTWGHTQEYAQSIEKEKARTPKENEEAQVKANELFAQFASCISLGASHATTQNLCALWQAHITKYYYTCTKPILASLAIMYIADERFTTNLDAFGQGTAQLMHDALQIYCAQ